MRKRLYTALDECNGSEAFGSSGKVGVTGESLKRKCQRDMSVDEMFSVCGNLFDCVKCDVLELDMGPVCVEQEEDITPVALVHNIVATTQIVSTVMPIDLNVIARLLPNSYYDRQKFAAITIRIHDPTCTALLFTSGKLVLTGCKGWYECVLASMHIVKMLRRYCDGVDFRVCENTIQNIVGHVEVPIPPGAKLDLDQLYDTHCTHCTYQRNMFPGLIFRPDKSPIVLLCFYSGRIVITGGKSVQDICIGWKRLWPLVKQFISA